MKIQMHLFFVLFVAFSSCAQDKSAAFSSISDSTLLTNRQILKDFFLCKCIDNGFKENNIFKSDHSVSVLVEMADYRAEAFASVDSLAKTIARTPVSNLTGRRGLLINCIDYYNAKQLDDFVKGLDNRIDRRAR